MRSYFSTASSYVQVLQDLVMLGNEVQVGPEMTTEMVPFVAKFIRPMRRLIDPPGRNLNFAFSVVETLDVLMNKNPGLAPIFVKRLSNWMRDGKFPGHYGQRMNASPKGLPSPYKAVPWQLWRCYDELLQRPTSRRATITIHNPIIEAYMSKDVACTMDLQFLLRDNKLDCIAHMRSNDALWGFCYDTWMFQFLQESLASWLGVELGYYYHIAGSFHYYHERHKAIQKIVNRLPPMYPYIRNMNPIPIPPMTPEEWGSIIEAMWINTRDTLDPFMDVSVDFQAEQASEMIEPFRSYQWAILAEIARKRRLREISEKIYKNMPTSDVKQWVGRRCKIT